MRFFSYFADAGKTIMSNKMRSGLSTLGIIIGMLSVIVMMAIGQGTEAQIMKYMGDLMKNKITISAGWGYNAWDEEKGKPWTYIKEIYFSEETINYLEQYFPELKGKISYEIRADNGEARLKSKKAYVSVVGVPQHWFGLNERNIAEGGKLEQSYYDKMSFVAVINNNLKKELFKTISPIGKKLRVWKREYTIIGILEESDFERDSKMYIPSSTAMERINHNNRISRLEIILPPEEDNQLWQDRISYLLLKKFNQPNKSAAGFEVYSWAKDTEAYKQSMAMFKYLLLGIGAISLLVGGIGVMNIMIVSVTERTREIWIRKAIGALNRDIVTQFLVESVVITLVGGLIAFVLSHGVAYGLNRFVFTWEEAEMKVLIDLKVVIVAFSLTALTGILFGILPARKAAKLKPIDALRFE